MKSGFGWSWLLMDLQSPNSKVDDIHRLRKQCENRGSGVKLGLVSPILIIFHLFLVTAKKHVWQKIHPKITKYHCYIRRSPLSTQMQWCLSSNLSLVWWNLGWLEEQAGEISAFFASLPHSTGQNLENTKNFDNSEGYEKQAIEKKLPHEYACREPKKIMGKWSRKLWQKHKLARGGSGILASRRRWSPKWGDVAAPPAPLSTHRGFARPQRLAFSATHGFQTQQEQSQSNPTETKICCEITTWTEHRQGFCWNRRPAEILARRWNRQRCAMCFVGSWDPGLCFFGCCNAGSVENAKTWCLSEWEIQRRWQIRKAELDKKQVNWKQDQHNISTCSEFCFLATLNSSALGGLKWQFPCCHRKPTKWLRWMGHLSTKVHRCHWGERTPFQQFASKSKVLPSICWLIHWSAFGCSSHGNACGISFNKAWHQLFPP